MSKDFDVSGAKKHLKKLKSEKKELNKQIKKTKKRIKMWDGFVRREKRER